MQTEVIPGPAIARCKSAAEIFLGGQARPGKDVTAELIRLGFSLATIGRTKARHFYHFKEGWDGPWMMVELKPWHQSKSRRLPRDLTFLSAQRFTSWLLASLGT